MFKENSYKLGDFHPDILTGTILDKKSVTKILKQYLTLSYFFFKEDRNVIVPFCKIHNDSSIDVSQDGTLLGVFVPSEYGFPVDAELKVLSLRKSNFGQCIYSRKYGKGVLHLIGF